MGAWLGSCGLLLLQNQRSRPGVRESQNLGRIDESSSGWAQLLKAFCSHASPLRPEFHESPMSPYNLTTYPSLWLKSAQASFSPLQLPGALAR